MQKKMIKENLARQTVVSTTGRFQTPLNLLRLDMKICDECGEPNHIQSVYCGGCGATIVYIPEDKWTPEDPAELQYRWFEVRMNNRASKLNLKSEVK